MHLCDPKLYQIFFFATTKKLTIDIESGFSNVCPESVNEKRDDHGKYLVTSVGTLRPPRGEKSFPVHQVGKKNGQSVGRGSFFFLMYFFYKQECTVGGGGGGGE